MSLPPDTIRVKRKRGAEDGPVDFLRVEGNSNKRLRGSTGSSSLLTDDSTWVYRRKTLPPPDLERADHPHHHHHNHHHPDGRLLPTPSAFVSWPPPELCPPVIHATTGDRPIRKPAASAPAHAIAIAQGQQRTPPAAAKSKTGTVPADGRAAAAVTQPAPARLSQPAHDPVPLRRFHLSRETDTQSTGNQARKRSTAVVFVERGTKKTRQGDDPDSGSRPGSGALEVSPESDIVGDGATTAAALTSTTTVRVEDGSQERQGRTLESTAQAFKRPGARARTPVLGVRPGLPVSLASRGDMDMSQIAREMDAYTLSQIVSNLDRLEAEKRERPIATRNLMAGHNQAGKPTLGPKMAKRWTERNPVLADEIEQRQQDKSELMDVDGPEASSSGDEDNYVIETYERVPASRLDASQVAPAQVGLLVFDTEPDKIDFFYGNESDSEDEDPDEEDEDAENYYAADYPEEEVAWDDEVDRDPYSFRNGYSSDREVSDFIDPTHLDGEDSDADEPAAAAEATAAFPRTLTKTAAWFEQY